jgi:hypothetical protein
LGIGTDDFDGMVIKTVPDHHVAQITPVKKFDVNLRVQFTQTAYFAVLAGSQLRSDSRQFNVEIFIRQVEVRRESFRYFAGFIPCQGEGTRFVFPFNAIIVKNTGKLLFDRVDELNIVCRLRIFQKTPPTVPGKSPAMVLVSGVSGNLP